MVPQTLLSVPTFDKFIGVGPGLNPFPDNPAAQNLKTIKFPGKTLVLNNVKIRTIWEQFRVFLKL